MSTDTTTGTNILVINGTIDSASDLETQLSLNGDFELTLGGNDFADNDGFLVLWDDGTDSYLSLVINSSGADITGGGTLSTSDLTVTTVLTLVGIADATDINAANLGTAFNT